MMEEWGKVEFGIISDFKNGINFDRNQKGVIGVPTIDVKNMYTDSCYVNTQDIYSVNKKIPKDYYLQNDDLLFVRSSLKEEGVGWTSLYKGEPYKVTYCGFIIRARLFDKYKSIIDSKFLTYFFRTDLARKELVSGSGRVAITNINQGLLSQIKIPVPPLPEQRKIAYVLSTVQKAIEQQDKLIRHTTELKKALMQKLFTEGIGWLSGAETRQKQTEIGWVPESWEVVKIESLFDIQQGKQVSKSNRIGNNQKPFLRTANVYWGYIDFTELDEMNFSKEEENKFTLKKDDLLVCEGGDVGRTSIWEYDKRRIYYQNHLHRLRRKEDNIIPKYFMYWMSLIVQETSYVKDAGNRTTIPNLSKSRLGGLYFPNPEIEYQRKVVSVLDGLDKKIMFNQKKKQILSDLFKTLLHELMTGERRVHEIDFDAERSQGAERLVLSEVEASRSPVIEYPIKDHPLSIAAEPKPDYF